MKWLAVLLLVVIAVLCALGGFIASVDAEGRGGKLSLCLWGVAVAAVGGAIVVALT